MRYVFNVYGFELNITYVFKILLNPLMILALVSALGCRLVFYMMFKNLSMTETFLVTQFSAVFVLLTGYLVFGDELTIKQIIGAIMIIVGVGLI